MVTLFFLAVSFVIFACDTEARSVKFNGETRLQSGPNMEDMSDAADQRFEPPRR